MTTTGGEGVPLLSTEVAALAAGVKPNTIRQWVRRGKLTRYGSRGEARYDLDELTRLVVVDG